MNAVAHRVECSGPYYLRDYWGNDVDRFDTFEEALGVMQLRRANDASARDDLFNLDRADMRDSGGYTSGLTDDEQMALEEVGLS